ncbi:V-type proton ATPase subunit S1 [Biomphalaria glabrata]|uniref:V-type proton ATPase subunit S1-like n=1 Tax=Biomphalaria glabrata TaxID=6526 RepID=A0A2C9K1I4_BIOGL|nr:V-type proton ATPase subunit S1-like [Biomphalaria glabrata]KAI8730960.1 V-type proton ATPase subunit S1-like [Biomphalaria glabrata]KAI8782181.1 V-type proton ATPase subunit S1 [Biomphalaria glabrata]
MTMLNNLLLVVIIAVKCVFASDASIPALLWSPERSMAHLPEVMAHETVNADTFLNNYLDPLMKSSQNSAVIFLQDKLHVDDFTKFADVYSVDSDGGAFKNVKQLMEDHFSLELPQVLNPDDAVEKLKSFFKKIHTVSSIKDVENLNLSGDESFLLIVNLEPVHSQSDQEKALKQNDETIGAISHHLQKRRINYSALYTALSAGKGLNEHVESYANRHLMADASANNNGTFMNVSDGNIYVFLRGAKLCLKKGKENDHIYTDPCDLNATLDVNDNTASFSEWTNNTANIVLFFPNQTFENETFNVHFSILAQKKIDKWIMEQLVLNITFGPKSAYNTSLENATLSKDSQDLTISVLYSYHCTEMKMYLDYIHDKELEFYKGSYLLLDGFQVQPFNIQHDRFSYAQDCVPYFTTPIWMALFSSSFLLLILYFGTIMVLNLSIMDRYDDPKGKTIVVNAGAE